MHRRQVTAGLIQRARSRASLLHLGRGGGIRFHVVLAVMIVALLVGGSQAQAIFFDVEFRDSTYQVAAGDTYDDLVLEHESGFLRAALMIAGIDGVTSGASAGTNADYSTLITTTFTAAVSGVYTFQVGTDWGRGGASKAVHVGSGTVLDEFVTTNDIWWANDWNNPDVLTSVLTLAEDETYSLGWVGFEGCCAGNVTFRFSVDGSPFETLDDTNFGVFENPGSVPEPGTAILLGFGLVGLGVRTRR